MKAAELCAGYGGLALAVEHVFGAETAWVSEYEDAPSKILAHHWPNVLNHGDMTKIDWSAVEPVDIISGGTPCQDLSGAGRRKGMTEGTRSNLWVQMREAIAIIKPTYVVWENVRGAYSAEANSDLEQCSGCLGDSTDRGVVLRALGRVLGDLADLGFNAEWRGLRAADVGAPHGRFRVFILATHPGRLRRQQGRFTGPREATGGRAFSQPVGRTGKPTPNPSVIGLEAGRLSSGSTTQEPEHNNRFRVLREYSAPVERWGRVTRPAPEPALRNKRGGISTNPAFVEWMMGVPEGWITDVPGLTRNEALKAAGNGVVPQQAIAALQDMLRSGA